jgi:hypothetical protein
MENMNTIMGQNQAYLDNLSEQYQRDALSAVMLGEKSDLFTEEEQAQLDQLHSDYEAAMEAYEESGGTDEKAALDLENIYNDTSALGTAFYESSNLFQENQESEIDLLTMIREGVAGLPAALNEYNLSLVKSLGLASTYHSGIAGDSSAGNLDNYTDDGGTIHSTAQSTKNGWYDDGGNWHSNASGLETVPYDNYPTLLHQGERVLTANQARALDSAGTGIHIQIGEMTVREDADIDKIASALLEKIQLAQMAG